MSRKRAATDDRYDENDLLGIKVSHSETLFKEGQDVILTLKDSNVLDNDEDILENVNLIDQEKATKNQENKSSKPDYNPFDEPEYDSFGRFKKKNLLSKYDEEIEGLKKESFRIGLDESRRIEQLEELKSSLNKESGKVSLELPKYKVASEYFTENEIVTFKKPKKTTKKSIKKSTKNKGEEEKEEDDKITADSLLPLGNENNLNDHGSRNNNNNTINNKPRNKRREVEVEDEELIDDAFLEHQNLLQNAIKKNKIKTKDELASSSSKSNKKSSSKSSSDSKHHHKSSSSSRSSSKSSKNETKSTKTEIKKERKMSDNEEEDDDEDDFQIPDEEIYGTALEEDDLQVELMKSLDKARKIKQKERLENELNLEKISEQAFALNETELEAESNRNNLFENRDDDKIINSTAEFCRNLGDISTLKYGGKDEDEELLDFEKDLLEEKGEQVNGDDEDDDDQMDIDDDDNNKNFKTIRNKWNEVDFKTEQPRTSDLIENKTVILEEEPDVSNGLAGALKLAMKKGYLDKEIKKSNISINASSLQAKNYTIEEKFYDDDKFSRRERFNDRYNSSLNEFKEKINYKPDVKLEYNDDQGRTLNQKEAFRILSHKFHGKAPGKNKIDKRMKKIEQEIVSTNN